MSEASKDKKSVNTPPGRLDEGAVPPPPRPVAPNSQPQPKPQQPPQK